MLRINPTVTEQAKKIYDNLPLKDKKHFVSDAIIEKHARQTGTDLQTKVDELEKKVQAIIDRMKGEGNAKI